MADLEDLCGRTLGEFVLRERIGNGGFGDVYRAEQLGLGRVAVVKVPKLRLRRDSAALRRFMREAQLASRLDHPYAAHVYAFGIEERDGLFWIAMEMVHGETLDHWLRERGPLSLDLLVPFLERVAEVVQTAHDCGIVHRDLKPSNIMVIERAGQLLPKLLDFGIAKLLHGAYPYGSETAYVDVDDPWPKIAYVDGEEYADAEDPARTGSRPSSGKCSTSNCTPSGGGPYRRQGQFSITSSPAVIGSPPYMAPEQWGGATVGSLSDLYALGVIAYEALSGRRPFAALTADRYSELHRLAPVPPLGDGSSPSLDRFFQRALAKHPEDRWGSALGLAAALRTEFETRMRTQVRIAARQWQDRGRPADLVWRDTTLSELERWLRIGAPQLTGMETEFVDASRAHFAASRRRAAMMRRGLAVLAIGCVVGGLQYRTALQTRIAERQAAEQLVTQSEIEQGRAALLYDELADARQHLGEAYRRGDRSPAVSFMFARALQPRLAELASFAAVSGRMWSAAFSPDGRRIVTTDDKSAQIWDAETYRRLLTLPHGNRVARAVFSPDGVRLVTVCYDGQLRVWDAANGEQLRALTYGVRRPHYYLVAMSPDGSRVAAIDDGGAIAHVWDVESGAPLAELRNDGSAFPSIGFSADGHWLATGGGNDVRIFDTVNWSQALTLEGPNVRALSFDPTGSRIVTGGTNGDATLWSIPNGERIRRLREIGDPIDKVAFSPNGELIVTASRDGMVQVWNAASGRLQSYFNPLRNKILTTGFDATSKLVVAGAGNAAIAISDAITGMTVSLLEGSDGPIRTAQFDPNSRRVVSASWDGTARIWSNASAYRHSIAAQIADECGLDAGAAPDSRFVAIGCRGRVTRIWDTVRGELLAELPSVTAVDGDFASAFPVVSAAGDLAAIARGNTVDLYELPGGRRLHTILHGSAVSAVAFEDIGTRLVSGDVGGGLMVTSESQVTMSLPRSAGAIDAAVFLSNGRVLATDASARMRVSDTERGTVLADVALPFRAALLRTAPNGDRLVTLAYTAGGAPILWSLDRYQPIAPLDGHIGRVFSARFVAGGDVVTAGGDGTARRWDGTTGKLRQTYRGRTRFLADATVSPDGQFMIGGGAEGMMQFWDAASGQLLWKVHAHKSHLIALRFEDLDIITRGFGGDVARWTLPAADHVIGAMPANLAGR